MDQLPSALGEVLHTQGKAPPAPETAPQVPWLPGALRKYLGQGRVLDLKSPADPCGGPVTPGAVVRPPGHRPDTSEPPAYDAVFCRAPELLASPAGLRDWFRRLRNGGHMLVAVPLAAEGEAAADGSDAGLTPAGLRRVVAAALAPEAFEIAEVSEVPDRGDIRSPGGVKLCLVLRKTAETPDHDESDDGRAAPPTPPEAEALIPFALAEPEAPQAPGMTAMGSLLVRDFRPQPVEVRNILVLKLDHHGDFIIGLPALRELRETFPAAHITLVCGKWNMETARATGLADEVRSLAFFAERAVDWNGKPTGVSWAEIDNTLRGRFDLAIDLRVDEDTRPLLGRVDAGLRCGIGSQAQFPALDIALPDLPREPAAPRESATKVDIPPGATRSFPPGGFVSDLETRTGGWHEGRFPGGERFVVRSGTMRLPAGRYRADFDLSVPGFLPGARGVGVSIEVFGDDGRKLAARAFGRASLRRLSMARASLEFECIGEHPGCEFRVRLTGKPLTGRLRFGGMKLSRLQSNGARLRPSELHVGEKLSLLVNLIRQRCLPLAVPSIAPAAAERTDAALRIVMVPFSNSTVRDWPTPQYAELIGLLADRFDCVVTLVGAPGQVAQAEKLMHALPDSVPAAKVCNLVGKTKWSDLPALLAAADLVICNNSGAAHQAAMLGTRTLAIYSGSHQPLEWGPRGPRARAIMLSVPCSPCGYERVEDCPGGHACMRLLTPEMVISQVEQMLSAA